jgi:hypothetical protein
MSEFEKKFEPTESYKNKLEDIRKLPQETEELKLEKKRKSKRIKNGGHARQCETHG